MTKNESPTDQGKLPNKDLFGDASLGHTVGLGYKVSHLDTLFDILLCFGFTNCSFVLDRIKSNTHNFPKYDFLKELLLETSSVHSL